MANIFTERLWRSITYEEIHLKAYADGLEARAGMGKWVYFSNFRRPPPRDEPSDADAMAVWRAGVDAIEAAAKTVDMPLRLANATALPTSLRWPFDQASLAGTFGQLRPRQTRKSHQAA